MKALCLMAVAHASQVTPVQKVVTLMENMVEKGKSEIEAEKTQFAEYVTFCVKTPPRRRSLPSKKLTNESRPSPHLLIRRPLVWTS